MSNKPSDKTDRAALETLREIMEQYTKQRTRWVAKKGTSAGFDAWFTKQVMG